MLKKQSFAIVYADEHFEQANTLLAMLSKASYAFGINVDKDPLWVDCRTSTAQNYIDEIKNKVTKKIEVVIVLLGRKETKTQVKKHLVQQGIISQFILADTVYYKATAIGVFSNLIKQINAKLGLDLYRL